MPKKSKTSKRKSKPHVKANSNPNSTNNTNTNTSLELQNALDQLSTYVSTFYRALYNSPPDGSPFVQEGHLLTQVYKKCLETAENVMQLQRKDENVEDVEQHSVEDQEEDRHDELVWKRFEDWLLEEGSVDMSKFPVQIGRMKEDGRSNEYGLFATRDIGYNETVLEIPSRLICSPFVEDYYSQGDIGEGENISTSTTLEQSSLQTERELPGHLLLITHLMNHHWKSTRPSTENATASHTSLNFKAYLDTLPPTNYYRDSNPLYWSYSEQVLLKEVGTSHLKRALLNQIQTIHDYLQIRKMMQERHSSSYTKKSSHGKVTSKLFESRDEGIPLSEFTLDLFIWATATIHSRQYRIQDSVGMATSLQTNDAGIFDHSLVPLYDLLNHDDSDRACVTKLKIESNENGKDGNGDATCITSYHLLVQTPVPLKNCGEQEQEAVPCFKRGDEVTLYYGERSSAQLFFDSGFLHCYIPKPDLQHIFRNLNRKDHFVLRLALPPAEIDQHDKVRELIAAKLGFRAYLDHGCDHDGKHLSNLAGECIKKFEGCEKSTKLFTKKAQDKSTRDKECSLIKEVPVSFHDPCCEEVVAAMVLCVADKNELTQLLRNVSSGDSDTLTNTLKLEKKHEYLATQLIEHYSTTSSSNENDKVDLKKLIICDRFKRCEDSTMRLWLDSFCNKEKDVFH